ncbi:hypothetical protein [Algisphaera agarilytica]|uniref:Uncharacterized protein n=1 Tax=Algisphaera agarilytica TaxID=1385975 RepID=A0A7X0H3E8_9BACT|nr:hypothetical protein [Algisphaera agarilytica]MBB6428347.1 hypothetical protein [Algisphaera agarilytica]
MTRLKFLMLAGSISLTGAMVGCDEQIAQTAKARAELGEAITVLDEAEQGFAYGEGDYSKARMDLLSEAESKLKAVIAQDVDQLAKSGAHRLLAGVSSSKANASIDKAAKGFTQINGQSAGLFNQLGTVQRINALIVSRTGDGGEIIAALDEGQGLIKQSKAAVNASLAELSVQREAATLNAEKFNGQAASHLTRAQEFEEQSRVAPNDEVKQEVFTKAYSAEIDAQEAQRLAQEQEITAKLVSEQIASLKKEIELWDKMSAQLTELKKRVEAEGAAAARDLDSAGGERVLGMTNVAEGVDLLVGLYNDNVDANLAAATAGMNDAISQLDSAIRFADAADRKTLRFEQLGAKAELAGVLSRHANYAGDFSQMLASVLESPAVAGAPAAAEFQSKRDQYANQAAELAKQAREVITDGLAQTEEMTGEDVVGQATQGLAQAFRTYGDQLN